MHALRTQPATQGAWLCEALWEKESKGIMCLGAAHSISSIDALKRGAKPGGCASIGVAVTCASIACSVTSSMRQSSFVSMVGGDACTT